MEAMQNLWEKIKRLSDEEWQRLRNRRDLLSKKDKANDSLQNLVGSIPKEDLEQMKEAIDWMSVRGVAPDLLDGEDAQEWVSRSRSQSDEGRTP